MSVSKDRKYTKEFIYNLLEGIKGKTLGEVDSSRQFERTQKSEKITGIAGDVIEQSVFGYERDSKQECDIEIDGVLTELKTTGVRIPKSDLKNAKGKIGEAYNRLLSAKEGISITGVTFEPTIQTDFFTSHFWEKSEHLLIVFYEYKPYEVVPASAYAEFPIVGYCYNRFSDSEKAKLKKDWEIVRDYLTPIYKKYTSQDERNEKLVGFTHILRQDLLLIELVPGFKKKIGEGKISYQKPRYRLKQTFVNHIVKEHFANQRNDLEVNLKESFSSFADLDKQCHVLSEVYRGKTFLQLKELLNIETDFSTKDFAAQCVIHMFGAQTKRLNQIADFAKTGIIAKTITLTSTGKRTEDMKLKHIDFEEWADRDIDFEDSEVYAYFCEHSFLCPIFHEHGDMSPKKRSETPEEYHKRIAQEVAHTTFEGFKRFAFDQDFMEQQVKRTWEDSRALIHRNTLAWVYDMDKDGNYQRNASGSYKGAPNFPKSSSYDVFFRGGGNDSSDSAKTECVNGISMMPQFFWLRGSYIVNKLENLPYL
jgi:hypothetical protein